MEEKHAAAPESIASVAMKQEYPPSEYCASEPPPAYHKGQSSAVQVAKIIAVTVVTVSFVLGIFILASAYVTATASCRQLEQELELLGQVADRFEGENEAPLMPEALRAEEPKTSKREGKEQVQPAPKQPPTIKEIDDNSIDTSSDEAEKKVHFKLPLQLDFDELAGNLIAKNQKSKMNCVVEKKRAEEIVDHQPKTVRLPFGLNLTTDPRLEKVTGERMVIICESGDMQSTEPKSEKPEPEQEQEDDEEQETIMIQPVMIPIPQTPFRTHMPQQMAPQERPRFEFRPYQQVGVMRPPMPPMRPPMDPFRPPIRPFEQRQPEEVQRVVAVRPDFYQPRQRSEEMEQQPQRNPDVMFVPQRVQIHVEAQQPQLVQEQADASPNPIIQNIIRHIIAQKISEAVQKQQQQQQQPEQARPFPALPEEILTQLNRLPNQDRVIVAVSEPESSEEESSDSNDESVETQDMTDDQKQQRMLQNGDRQAYMRRLPVNIPVNMMQQQQQPQEQQVVQNDENRPHFLQPRSVAEEPKSRVARSVANNPLLPEKRLKRCACDCAC